MAPVSLAFPPGVFGQLLGVCSLSHMLPPPLPLSAGQYHLAWTAGPLGSATK